MPEITVDKVSFNAQSNIELNAAGDMVLTSGDATAPGAILVVQKDGGALIDGDAIATQLYVDGAVQEQSVSLAQTFASKTYVDQKVTAAAAPTPPAFIAPTFSAGWANHGNTPNFAQSNAGYRKHVDGTVELTGLVDGQLAATSIFNLPSGFRPTKQQCFLVNCASSGDTVGFVKIQPNGNVLFSSGTPSQVFLTGIRFPLI